MRIKYNQIVFMKTNRHSNKRRTTTKEKQRREYTQIVLQVVEDLNTLR